MKEEWRDVKGYEGLYQVSNLGRVRSYDRWTNQKLGSMQLRKGRILKPSPHPKGYLQVKLYADGVRKSYLIHQLVAMTFLENPDNLPIVNHKNEDKTDNRACNLEYCTIEYNNCFGTRLERQGKTLSNTMTEKNKRKRAA